MTQMTSGIKGDAATVPRRRTISPRAIRCRWRRPEQGDAKRLIDRKFADTAVQADMELWPFKVLSSSGDKTMIRVQSTREERMFHSGEISFRILTKMKETTEAYLDTKVKHAVANTSAYFSDSQRQTTKDVEPISGLMCYGSSTSRSQKGDRGRNVLIHDMDSGTFDVSLLTIFEMSDTQLGGEDFKNRTVGLFTQDFKPKKPREGVDRQPSRCPQ